MIFKIVQISVDARGYFVFHCGCEEAPLRSTKETQTYNDMLRISLVSGLQMPRSSCSKLDIRATPDPGKI